MTETGPASTGGVRRLPGQLQGPACDPTYGPRPASGPVRKLTGGFAGRTAKGWLRAGLLAAGLAGAVVGAGADAAGIKPRPAKPAAVLTGDAAAGQVKADSERCLECHAPPGIEQGYSAGEDGKFARLAGQQQAYIVKQVEDFRAGRRSNDFMAMMAGSISDQDVADIAAYFAAQPAMPAARRNAATVGATGAAAQLFRQGDAGRKVGACAACHGAAGEGVAGVAPVIGGQGRRYLSQQLHNWRSGARNNNAVMKEVASGLTDQEIEALALYVSEM